LAATPTQIIIESQGGRITAAALRLFPWFLPAERLLSWPSQWRWRLLGRNSIGRDQEVTVGSEVVDGAVAEFSIAWDVISLEEHKGGMDDGDMITGGNGGREDGNE